MEFPSASSKRDSNEAPSPVPEEISIRLSLLLEEEASLSAEVQDLGIAKSTTQIGTYAGFLGASLLLGRFMGSIPWGILADRAGHKAVMFAGTSSTCIFITVFGFSTNYWMALVSRFLIGLANGMLATIRAYAVEICSTRHQSLSLSLVGTMWGVGLIIGPALGGYLAQPSEKLPSIFPSGSLFDSYPYALPSICIAVMAMTGFILCFWLPESLHIHKESEANGNSGICNTKKDSNHGFQKQEGNEVEVSKGELQSVEKRLWKNQKFIASLSVNALWVLHATAYSEILPVWAASPVVYGGLAFTTSDVANVLALCGFGMLVFQLLFYPRLLRSFGTIMCLRVSMFLSIPLTALYPLLASLDGTILWMVLIPVSMAKSVLSIASLTGTFILVNNSVVKAQRGVANGFSTSVMSGFQAIGPACAGALFSWSEERMDASFLPGMWMVFSILSALPFFACLNTFEPFLPSSLDKPLQEESDSK